MTNRNKSRIYEWAGALYDSAGFMLSLIILMILILAVNFLMGCSASKPVRTAFDAGDRPCFFTEYRKVMVVSCDPGRAEVYPPVVMSSGEDGTFLGVFQDILDLKIFQPTLIEGVSIFGGGG